MAFCDKEKQLVDGGITCLDNKFIINYLPDAPDVRSAVYLLGLVLSESKGADNDIATIANKLNISTEDVMACYQYWEEMGLVHIASDNPPRVLYLSMRQGTTALKKIKPSKYKKFNIEMQDAIRGRMITSQEFNEYHLFLEDTTFQPEALVAIAKYCTELKGNDINYHYILTVARNQLHKGATTLETVQQNLSTQQKYDDDLKLVFKALAVNRKIDYTDREMYEKWTVDFGFTQDTICTIAKKCKRGGMAKLDSCLVEYYKKGVFDAKEIEHYEQQKQSLFELAKTINKTIGVYYQSVDAIVDEYLSNWVRLGYDGETLVAIAKYCFKSGIRTLNGLASVVEKLHKHGITTVASLQQYLHRLAQKDEQIKQVLAWAGLERNVTQSDRTLFRTWTEIWEMPMDVVEFVAKKSAGTTAPTAYVNRVLADYKQRGIKTVEQAQAIQQSTATTAKPQKRAIIGDDLERREYTDEQLASLINAFDD